MSLFVTQPLQCLQNCPRTSLGTLVVRSQLVFQVIHGEEGGRGVLRQRDRVLTDVEIDRYLSACEQPWKDVATIILGTGMRPGEVFALRWENVLLNEDGAGLVQVTQGKSKAARRVLPMLPQVFNALNSRCKAQGEPANGWVFPSRSRVGHFESSTAKGFHARALKKANENLDAQQLNELKRFEPYVLRHTALTRLGETCDAFTLARIAGHSSITITQRYVHPQADAIERAFSKLGGHKTGHSEKQALLEKKKVPRNFFWRKRLVGEPGRTRTSNPLIKSQLLYH